MKENSTMRLSKVLLEIKQIRYLLLQAKVLLFSLLVMTYFLCTLNAEAALVTPPVYYVRAAASGFNDGSNWTNAFTTLPATLVRGAIYYIADGSYGSYTFRDTESSAIYVYIKKASSIDHGPAIDWQATYGAGHATFSTWAFDTGYYDIDGQVGGGPSSWDSGFGFIVSSTKGYRVTLNANVTYINIRHTEISNTDNTADDLNYGHLVNAQTNVSYINFSYCKIHHVFGCCFKSRAGNDNWTVEYSKVGDNTGTSLNHSEIWSVLGSDNMIIRNNWFFQWRSTGAIIAINGVEGLYGDDNICENWKIYGNVFQQGGTQANYVIAVIDDASNQQFARGWRVYNNTFIDISSVNNSVNACRLDTYGIVDNLFENNVFYGNTVTMLVGGVSVEDYNSYQGSNAYFKGVHDSLLTSSPFVNYGGGDYRLSTGLTGVTLTSDYSMDMLGAARGADGVWDKGAFEFINGSRQVLARPPAPSNLTAY